MAQEKMDSWWEYAREQAKAERELKIEKWVYISIEYKEENGVYDVYCAHDIQSVAKALEKAEENEDGCVLTYALYTDFSYIVKGLFYTLIMFINSTLCCSC